jgi:hypothetical protein
MTEGLLPRIAAKRRAFSYLIATVMLCWPAIWNGYPIVFADTGTYLSQAIHHYAGWDRPVFYSLFMLPLHATVTTWPVVVVQAALTAWVLRLVCRVLAPEVTPCAFVAGVAALSLCTWLPWIVCELMPDVFTPLLVLVLCVLVLAPDRLSESERMLLAALAAFMIASQLSSLLLWSGMALALAVMRPLRPRYRRSRVADPNPAITHEQRSCSTRRTLAPRSWRAVTSLILLPPALAVLALCTVNFAAYGRFAVAPFGNVFLLARVLYDGPGMAVLRRDCPAAGWSLCPFLDRFPPASDEFLWSADSPLNLAGGAKAVSRDAGAIIAAAVLSDPAGIARAALAKTLEQIRRFDSGDGLEAWPRLVTPWIERDFPKTERTAYASALQQRGLLKVPPPLAMLHRTTAIGGVLACLLLLPLAIRRRAECASFVAAVLVALPLSAAITGALSTPHARYQSRIMWLPAFVAAVSLASLRRTGTANRPELASGVLLPEIPVRSR